MIRLLIGGAGVLLLIAGWRIFAVGRQQPLTELQRRRAAWGGMPVAFKQTQPANPAALDLTWWERKRRA